MKKILLTKGKIAKVDDADFTKVNQHKWYASFSAAKWYAARGIRINGHVITIYMHRFIMNCPVGMEIDHKNTDSLDNRRVNMEICTKKENLKRLWRRKNAANVT